MKLCSSDFLQRIVGTILILGNEIFCFLKKPTFPQINVKPSCRHKIVNSHSNKPFEIENDDHSNQTENTTEFPQDQTSVEPNRNATDNTQQNPLQFQNLPTLR